MKTNQFIGVGRCLNPNGDTVCRMGCAGNARCFYLVATPCEQPKYNHQDALDYAEKMGLPTKFPL